MITVIMMAMTMAESLECAAVHLHSSYRCVISVMGDGILLFRSLPKVPQVLLIMNQKQ